MVRPLQRKRRREGANDLSGQLITLVDPSSRASEAYRTLRTNLMYAFLDVPPKVIVVTSPGPHEGKSTVCANLGVVMAQADKNTLVLDCEFRRPVMHKMFALKNVCGLTDVLAGERSLPQVWAEPVRGLKVVTVGPIPLSPTEVLSSRRFAEFVDEVRREFDYVLIDSPPAQLVSDPVALASQGDGVLLVIDAQKTRKVALRRAVRSFRAVGANVLGTVMNNFPKSTTDYYGGYM